MRTKGTSWLSRFLRHFRMGPHLKSVRRSNDGMLTTAKFEASYWLPCLMMSRSTIKKSAPSVLIGEASTSKAKGKRAGRWKRKKGKAKVKTVVVTKDAKSAPIAPVGMGRERRGWVLSSSRGQTISVPIAVRKGIGRGIVPIYLPVKVLQRSRMLSKDEVVRLGDGKAIAAEAVGIINLVIWHARLGHISQDRMKRLVDSKSLEIDNMDNLPACESYLKGKMTRKPFVGQSYVYLMGYKSEAFVRFKQFRLEVENQTCRKIKTLWSDRGGEYISGEFIDYLKKNGIVSQWTPPRRP
ncbi:hypothetical protein Sango_2104000 [Sesamum angolense]|uniref:GAG-pre-integrase domain-containing protein n=1 Tax=Sesamum angolense TaxID=2727404 RepID=A0AAE2BM48_9LAMI|nr:hypothetical protein Sango_2104000 [Sesamum angolense]